ncbi:hypothetical protein NVP2275O_184 [Vibrio phage 2.275.O._10N.286.54.E11]|nr:hypothetical protein NVP2275O_184 [Vibrio phage 2.275.O._10N.286.54.E11]
MNFFQRIKYRYINGKGIEKAEELSSYISNLASEVSVSVQCTIEIERSSSISMFISTYPRVMPSISGAGSNTPKTKEPEMEYLSYKFTVKSGDEIIMLRDICGITDINKEKYFITKRLQAEVINRDTKKHFTKMIAHLEEQYPEVLADIVLNNLLPEKEIYSDED